MLITCQTQCPKPFISIISRCRGRWEGGSGWGTHVNPWLFHFNVWQNPLQYKKLKKLKKKEKNKLSYSHTKKKKFFQPPHKVCILIFSNVGELRFRSYNLPKVTQLGNGGARLQVCLTPENNVTRTQRHIVMQLLHSSRFKGMTNMPWLMFMRDTDKSGKWEEKRRLQVQKMKGQSEMEKNQTQYHTVATHSWSYHWCPNAAHKMLQTHTHTHTHTHRIPLSNTRCCRG